MRIFISLELPEDFKQEILKLSSELRSLCPYQIKWVEPENLHITFLFIGETKSENVETVTKMLEDRLSKLDIQTFSKPQLEIIPKRDPRILWVALENESEAIHNVWQRIKRDLKKYGFELDKKPLRFHITLGRIKKKLPADFIKEVLTRKIENRDIYVDKITLYESVLKPEGPEYYELAHYNLTKE